MTFTMVDIRHPSNGNFVKVVLREFDLHFQGQIFSCVCICFKKLRNQFPADFLSQHSESRNMDRFRSHHTGRKQTFKTPVDNLDPESLTRCVPQGSVIGQKEFIIHTGYIIETIDRLTINHQLFSDDSQFLTQTNHVSYGASTTTETLHQKSQGLVLFAAVAVRQTQTNQNRSALSSS